MALSAWALVHVSQGPEGVTPLDPCAAPFEQAGNPDGSTAVGCGDPAGPPLRGPARALFGQGLDPNQATAGALEALPGIGPARAAAIVAGRATGPYERLADLARVPGIGPVTLERMADWLAFPEPDGGSSAGVRRPKPGGGEATAP
ncbi:MAG: helix-hairpin-helix domain-containing protein [Myxococcota bacterium]